MSAAAGPGGPLARRESRRALHRSRSVPAVVVLVVVAAAAAWLAVESVLRITERPALLARPGAVADAAERVLQRPDPVTTLVGATLIVLGVVLIGLALAPGRRARRLMTHERLAVVVDDAVLASAVGRGAADTAGLGRDRVRTWISRRRVDVTLQGTSGVAPPLPEVQQRVEDLVRRTGARPDLRVHVRQSSKGAVS